VQLAMGLVRPWRVLLLDEITVDLDLLSRSRFLGWLRRESEQRGGTVVYATHILDGLAGWPTHLVHLSLGRCKKWGKMEEMLQAVPSAGKSGNSQLGDLVMQWLEEDLEERGPRNQQKPEGKSYEFMKAVGGYGFEKRN